MAEGAATELWIWRHPRVAAASGRCIGRTDLRLDPRRARRLARRIEACARREGLPRCVWTSPLDRCAAVGRALRRRGFVHRIDARLAELDFGRWEGRSWSGIDAAEVARWEADFAGHAPGGGESLAALAARARCFVADRASEPRVLVIGHAGWINALGVDPARPPSAATWPAPLPQGTLLRIRPGPGA
jgi:alpha-ribazole phosphatase